MSNRQTRKQRGGRKSRKSRGGKASRKGRGSRRGLFSKIYGPVGSVIGAVDSIFGTATNTAKGVVHAGLSGVNRAGRNVTGRANKAVHNLVYKRRGRRSNRNRQSRRNRQNRQ